MFMVKVILKLDLWQLLLEYLKINLKKKALTVVRPGNQSRRFTHINDTVNVCFEAWKKNRCAHYSISHKKSYTILQVANMFKSQIIFLKKRPGERYASALTKIHLIIRYLEDMEK